MKTLKRQTPKGVEYKRTSDSDASNLTKIGWSYCPKTEWKENVRDFGKEKVKADESAPKTKKSKKEKKAKQD
jgi:hypothetical protein